MKALRVTSHQASVPEKLRQHFVVGMAATLACLVIGLFLYHYAQVPKWRIPGCYRIDRSFYPGSNADWQYRLFQFEITPNHEYLFHERLGDGSVKTTMGRVVYYRNSPPFLFRIEGGSLHSLVDEYPSHYRGNFRFYFVFETRFGNMFWRKSHSGHCDFGETGAA